MEQATESEMAIMARLAREAIEAGALGFTTSRTLAHKSVTGTLTPTYGSAHRELGKIAAAVGHTGTGVLQLITDYDDFALMRELVYVLGTAPDYEPDPGNTFQDQARRTGRTPEDIAYDALIADDGRGLIYQPFSNNAWGNLEAVREMLVHEHTIPGLGDGSAHVGSICDASFPTTLLQLWTRDRATGRLGLPYAIRRQTRDTAQSVGLRDRGQLRPDFKADINVIDMTALRIHSPRMAYDLPTGGRRLLQRADGYRHTIVSGVETYRDGVLTGELPGRVVRGAKSSPAGADTAEALS
jgi:N-acyl-D-aspartate/D-glutamate deacylase